MIDPADQFQIGEKVLYVRDGILTTIDGYVWVESIGGPPKLMGYRLVCGISVPAASIKKISKNPA